MIANARLLEVLAPGDPDEYGDPTDTISLWSGTAPCYLTRPRMAVTGGELERDVHGDELIVPGAKGRALASLIGSGPDWAATMVVVDDQRPGGRVMDYIVKGFEVAAAGTGVDHLRLTLRRAVGV